MHLTNNGSDPDPGPAIFVIDLQETWKTNFFCLLLFEGTFTSFFKVQKRHKSAGINVFPYYFCLTTERSGSIPLTNGSGSGRLKGIQIQRIQIVGSGSATLHFLFEKWCKRTFKKVISRKRAMTKNSRIRIRIWFISQMRRSRSGSEIKCHVMDLQYCFQLKKLVNFTWNHL